MTDTIPAQPTKKSKLIRNLKLTGIFIGCSIIFLFLMGVLSALQPFIFALGMGVAF